MSEVPMTSETQALLAADNLRCIARTVNATVETCQQIEGGADTIEALTDERDALTEALCNAHNERADLLQQNEAMAEALRKIELIIFGNGAQLGGKNYFAIREAIRAALNLEGK